MELLIGNEARAWILTLIEIVGAYAAYWFICWLAGAEPTLDGFALGVAIIALLDVKRLKTEGN